MASRRSRSIRRRRNWSATSRTMAANCVAKGQPEAVRVHDFKIPELGKVAPMGSMTSRPITAGSVLASTPIPPPSRSRASAAGGTSWDRRAIQVPAPDHHRRLRRQQRRAGQAVEARTPALRRRDRTESDGRSSAARHQQMEQDRAPPVRLHHQNWRGKPLVSHQVIVQLIGSRLPIPASRSAASSIATCTRRLKVTDAEMRAINITRDEFHASGTTPYRPTNNTLKRLFCIAS